jgi:hypothetical protein
MRAWHSVAFSGRTTVAVGYMDPATDLLAGGSNGYSLLVVALVSNIIAIVPGAVRGAIASGRDPRRPARRLPAAGGPGFMGAPKSPSSPPTSP